MPRVRVRAEAGAAALALSSSPLRHSGQISAFQGVQRYKGHSALN